MHVEGADICQIAMTPCLAKHSTMLQLGCLVGSIKTPQPQVMQQNHARAYRRRGYTTAAATYGTAIVAAQIAAGVK